MQIRWKSIYLSFRICTFLVCVLLFFASVDDVQTYKIQTTKKGNNPVRNGTRDPEITLVKHYACSLKGHSLLFPKV